MNNINTQSEKLVDFIRDGLVETEHYGYVVRCSKNHVAEKIGDDKNYPFYLRSCAKPLQASLLVDYGLDKEYDLTSSEIAICCASHAGEAVHINILKKLLEKFELSEADLKCGVIEPLSLRARNKMLLNDEKPSVLHNNCSGKHIMMLGLCKLKGWDISNYDDLNHPLQQEIKKRIYDLCELKHEYPITKDGCGVPICSMPLANMVFGYLNLFCNPQYEVIKNAFLENPYIIGGENRTDTKILESNLPAQGGSGNEVAAGGKLIAKVGAGGLCIVVNTEIEEGFVVKICDANMQAREIAVVDLINNLHWANIEVSHDILINNGDKVGEIVSMV